MYLNPGVPTIASYQQLTEDPVFTRMEKHAQAFTEKNRSVLQKYQKHWILDPFHQWSRQWEYPFVFQELEDYLHTHASKEIRILDAGSGVTFFPDFITTHHCQTFVECCDTNTAYPEMFQQIYPNHPRVRFQIEDLRCLSYPAQSFDLIYCISVLEHTHQYPLILHEFKRLLKRGGRLILTFDISLTETADIPVREAERLLLMLGELLTPFAESEPLNDTLKQPVVSTPAVHKTAPKLLPWKHPFLSHLKSALKRRRWPKGPYKNLTFYCGTFVKD